MTFTTNGGRHIYEGVHGSDLLNPARAIDYINQDQEPTIRQLISDLDVMLLADAYGYSVVLPSTIDTMHVTLDSLTGALLIQGGLTTAGAVVNDTIDVDLVGTNIVIEVNNTTETIPLANVSKIVIAGNGGTDSIDVDPVLEYLRQDIQFVVSSNDDAIEAVGQPTNDGIIDLSAIVPGNQTTLRAAIVEANAAGAARGIYVGRGTYNLDINGTGGATQGDLDITGNVTIVGAGAGATIIDAGTLTTPDRVFEINGANRSLNLSRVTVTGGNTSAFPVSSGIGGGINVVNGATFNLDQSAVVGNTGKWYGGAIYSAGTNTVTNITRSVITGNELSNTSAPAAYGGGGIYAISGSLTIANSMVANNNADVGEEDVFGVATVWVSQGNNSLTTLHSNLVGDFPTTGANPNYIGPANYVVTSVLDSFDGNRTSDLVERSLREAIDLANDDDNTLQTIWMPAWSFVLTRDRTTFGGGSLTDTNIAFGDLDISDSLVVRGVSASLTKVRWKPGTIDAVFELLGDYNGNGLAGGTADDGGVNFSDYLKWLQQFGQTNGTGVGQSSADGDDDGDVDNDDLAIWQYNYSNTLAIDPSVAVILA